MTTEAEALAELSAKVGESNQAMADAIVVMTQGIDEIHALAKEIQNNIDDPAKVKQLSDSLAASTGAFKNTLAAFKQTVDENQVVPPTAPVPETNTGGDTTTGTDTGGGDAQPST